MAKLSVVIIDDSESERRLLSERLGPEFNVHEASTGAEGVALVREVHPDCVLLDFRLPGATALDVMPDLAGELVLIITGNDNESLAIRCIGAGAQDYLIKNDISGDSLVRAMSFALERKRRQDRDQISALRAKVAERVIDEEVDENIAALEQMIERQRGGG